MDHATDDRPSPWPARPAGVATVRMLDVVPPGSSPGWAWVVTGLVGGGVLTVAWVLGPVSVVAIWLVGLAASAAAFCTPAGERTMRVRGVAVWARSVGIVGAALVAAVGAVLAAGTAGLLLWAAGLVAGWVVLVHRRQPALTGDDAAPVGTWPPAGWAPYRD